MSQEAKLLISGLNPAAGCGAVSLIEKETDEHPPAMHSALAWCRYGYKDQMVNFASHRVIGIAGRSNIERSTSNPPPADCKRRIMYSACRELLCRTVYFIKD